MSLRPTALRLHRPCSSEPRGRMKNLSMASLATTVTRLGVVLESDGEPDEAEGVLNPAVARTRDGRLLMYPRMVAAVNQSRVGITEADGSEDAPAFRRAGYALEPQAPYELRQS